MKGGTAVQTSQTKHTDSVTTKKVTVTCYLNSHVLILAIFTKIELIYIEIHSPWWHVIQIISFHLTC